MDKQRHFAALTSLTLTLIAATMGFFIVAFNTGRPAPERSGPGGLNPSLPGSPVWKIVTAKAVKFSLSRDKKNIDTL